MYGISFFTEAIFLLFILFVTALAIYMGIFHAHGENVSKTKKLVSGSVSFMFSLVAWSAMASWTYIGW